MQHGLAEPAERLAADELFELAERGSGARGLADDALIARVTAMVDWVNACGPYGPEQTRAIREQFLRLLTNRLRIALDRERFPGIADEKIERPVFIIGLARSGTTVLHSLLAEDSDVLKPQSWHMYSPSPPPGAGPVAEGRIAYATRQVTAWSDFAPDHKQFHPYVDKGAFQPIEDEELSALDFRGAYPFHFYRVPALESGMTPLSGDVANAFRFHRSLLQHFQWNTGKTRWVCKGPSHQMNLAALLAEYPDALCVWAHRPIGQIYASHVAIRAATYDAIRGRPIDWSSQAKDFVLGLKATLDAIMANDLIDDPRIMHLPFCEIMADPVGSVRSIYARQGLPFAAADEARITGWLADPENSSDRYGKYPYSYEALGLDQAWVEELFSDYSKRFELA